MPTKWTLFLLIAASHLWAQGQEMGSTVKGSAKGPTRDVVFYHRDLGKWWQNSETAKKLQLSDSQTAQLDQIFYDHRVKLIDYGAEMAKQDLKLQTLVDADVPDEAQVNAQVDQVLSARGKLEREYTMMNLDLRKVLSLEQWRQLKSIRGDGGGMGEKIFFQQKLAPGTPVPPLPPLPPGAGMVSPLPPLIEDGNL